MGECAYKVVTETREVTEPVGNSAMGTWPAVTLSVVNYANGGSVVTEEYTGDAHTEADRNGILTCATRHEDDPMGDQCVACEVMDGRAVMIAWPAVQAQDERAKSNMLAQGAIFWGARGYYSETTPSESLAASLEGKMKALRRMRKALDDGNVGRAKAWGSGKLANPSSGKVPDLEVPSPENLAKWYEEAGLGVCSDPRQDFGRDYRITALIEFIKGNIIM